MQKNLFVSDIAERQEVATVFLVDEIRLGQTKTGKPYLSLKLKDKTGIIEARAWNDAEAIMGLINEGDLAYVTGLAESFQGQLQLQVVSVKPVSDDKFPLGLFMPASPFDPDQMFGQLLALIDKVTEPHLAALLKSIFLDPELASAFKKAPAAKRFHHAYVSGLLEHTLSVASMADKLCQQYAYLNPSLLLTGAMLHDLGKIYEFDLGAKQDYTTQGRLLGHMMIGYTLISAKIDQLPNFPAGLAQLILHMIISHHGEYEYGSTKKPKIIEGLALYFLDDLDAKMNGMSTFIAKHANPQTGWTDYNNLMGRFFFLPNLDEILNEEAAQAAPAAAPKPSLSLSGGAKRKSKPQPEDTEDQMSLL